MKCIQNWRVDRSTTRDFTVNKSSKCRSLRTYSERGHFETCECRFFVWIAPARVLVFLLMSAVVGALSFFNSNAHLREMNMYENVRERPWGSINTRTQRFYTHLLSKKKQRVSCDCFFRLQAHTLHVQCLVCDFSRMLRNDCFSRLRYGKSVSNSHSCFDPSSRSSLQFLNYFDIDNDNSSAIH